MAYFCFLFTLLWVYMGICILFFCWAPNISSEIIYRSNSTFIKPFFDCFWLLYISVCIYTYIYMSILRILRLKSLIIFTLLYKNQSCNCVPTQTSLGMFSPWFPSYSVGDDLFSFREKRNGGFLLKSVYIQLFLNPCIISAVS